MFEFIPNKKKAQEIFQNTIIEHNPIVEDVCSRLIDINKIELIKNLLLVFYKIHKNNFLVGPCESLNFDSLCFLNNNTVKIIYNENLFFTNNSKETFRLAKDLTFYQKFINYTPPECVFDKKYNGVYSDIWILGCIIFKIITNGQEDLFILDTLNCSSDNFLYKFFFQIQNYIQILRTYKEKEDFYISLKVYKETFSFEKSLNTEKLFLISLLKDMLKYNSEERLSCDVLLQKYFNGINFSCSNFGNPILSKDIKEKKKNKFFCEFSLVDKKIKKEFPNIDLDQIYNDYLQKIPIKDSLIKIIDIFYKYFMINFLDIFSNNFDIFQEENLFLLKYIVLLKTIIIYVLCSYGSIHPIKDFEPFIKKFLLFEKKYNEPLLNDILLIQQYELLFKIIEDNKENILDLCQF